MNGQLFQSISSLLSNKRCLQKYENLFQISYIFEIFVIPDQAKKHSEQLVYFLNITVILICRLICNSSLKNISVSYFFSILTEHGLSFVVSKL